MNNINVREYIKDNFKGDNISELRQSIEDTINDGLEEALIGLGVFFEIIWNNGSEILKKELLNILKAHIN